MRDAVVNFDESFIVVLQAVLIAINKFFDSLKKICITY
jgi:hypothetical protein